MAGTYGSRTHLRLTPHTGFEIRDLHRHDNRPHFGINTVSKLSRHYMKIYIHINLNQILYLDNYRPVRALKVKEFNHNTKATVHF